MARRLGIEQAGGWYHITTRGSKRRAIFRSERDREHFCEQLGEMTRRFGVVLHAYVLNAEVESQNVRTPDVC